MLPLWLTFNSWVKNYGENAGGNARLHDALPRQQAKLVYFTVTVFVADPPRLLRTVMFCGFTGHENWPLYFPPPLLVSAPINALVAVTNACSVAVALVLVA